MPPSTPCELLLAGFSRTAQTNLPLSYSISDEPFTPQPLKTAGEGVVSSVKILKLISRLKNFDLIISIEKIIYEEKDEDVGRRR